MNNEEIKTPEVAPEAPAEAPPSAPAATPVRATITDPHKYFRMSNVFRSITVVLMIVCTILSMYLPVFKVDVAENSSLDYLYEDIEDTISFSVMDVIDDLGNEFTLCFSDDLEKIGKVYENPGKFTLTIEATAENNQANTSPLADMVKSFEDTRILLLIPYFLLLMPVIFVIGLAISVIVRLIQAIIGWIKPSAQIKKTDASACIVVTIFLAVCYLVHFFYSCFTLNIVNVVILAVVSIGAVVMNFIYRKHTKEIVDAQFGL